MEATSVKSKTNKITVRRKLLIAVAAILATLPLTTVWDRVSNPFLEIALASGFQSHACFTKAPGETDIVTPYDAEEAVEILVDADGDPNTPSVRPFAGANRYDTAIAIARRKINQAKRATPQSCTSVKPGINLYIVSGESLVDAVALPWPSSSIVLLTPPDELYSPIIDLIKKDVPLPTLTVVGGPSAVSESVFQTLSTLPISSISRIGGKNRYETAIMMNKSFDSRYSCYKGPLGEQLRDGSPEEVRTAALVAGDSETLADLIMARSFSDGRWAGSLPILLTSIHGLPEETAAAISAEYNISTAHELSIGIDKGKSSPTFNHIIIIGGPYSMLDFDTLENDLYAQGVETVTRLGGSTPAETSVKVLEEQERCRRATGQFSTGQSFSLALISEDALSDGIAAVGAIRPPPYYYPDCCEPQESSSPDEVDFLLVGTDDLPEVVRDYLLKRTNVKAIYAIGGEEAVSSDVVEAAVAAANSES